MPENVCERFLDHAEQGQFHFRRQSINWSSENLDEDPTPLDETFDIPFQGSDQSYLIQQRWVKEIRHCTDFLERLIPQRSTLCDQVVHFLFLRFIKLAQSC